MVRAGFAVTSMLLMAFFAAPAGAATWVVNRLDDAASDHACDTHCTLRDALAVAQAGDTIAWSPVLPFPSTTVLNDGPLSISQGVTLSGPGAAKLEISANDLSRVIEVEAGVAAVSIRGLTLSHGRFVAVAEGGDAEGGCVYSASAAPLILHDVMVRTCALQGGNGSPGVDGESLGGPGGHGGSVRGAAVRSSGPLQVRNSSLLDLSALAGKGGKGGNASNPAASFGGSGGNGGSVDGGVLHVSGAVHLDQVTIADVQVRSGDAGRGGIGEFFGYNGLRGSVTAGAIHSQLGSVVAFSVVDVGVVQLGNGEDLGVVDALVWRAEGGSGDAVLRGSAVLGQSVEFPNARRCSGDDFPPLDSLHDGGCFGHNFSNFSGPISNSGVTILANGIGVFVPETTSQLVDHVPLANCLDAFASPLARDIRGETRPFGPGCDAGPYEVTDLFLTDGFE